MDLETLSERILETNFGSEIVHSDEDPSSDISENELYHHGIKGMKWGVRRTPEQLGHKRMRFRDRQRRNESDEEYKERMKQRAQERKAKAESQARIKQKKLEIREQEATQRYLIRSQERLRKEEARSRERLKKVSDKKTESNFEKDEKAKSTRSLTDDELRAAIQRMQLEKQYKELTRTPDSPTVKAVKRIVGGAAEQIARAYITKYAMKGIDHLIQKKTGKKDPTDPKLGLPSGDDKKKKKKDTD